MKSLNLYRIKITGLNLHYVLDFFEREQIPVTKIKRPNRNTLICTLDQKAYNFFIKHPLSKAYQTEIIQIRGLNKILKFTALHLGIILGLFICTLSMLSYSRKIQKIIINNENHTCQNQKSCIFYEENFLELKDSLEALGIKEGNNLPPSDHLRNIEKQLVYQFKQISGVTIEIKGVYVFINIVEARLPEQDTSTNLISPVSGIIVSNCITSGNCLVKNGDIVTKGQTLVETVDDNKIVANFEIRTFYHETLIYDQNQTKYEKTGKKYTINNVSFYDLKFTNKTKPKYQLYQTETRNSYIFLNMFLPFKKQSITYYEIKEIKQEIPFETVEDQLKSELYEKTKLLLDSNATERHTSFATVNEGSRTRLDCYVEAIYTLKK